MKKVSVKKAPVKKAEVKVAEVAKKVTKKIVKKAVKKTAKKVIKKVVKLPTYDPKEHVKLSDLAREMKMDYRSCFLKQKRLGVFSFKCLLLDREVVCFNLENAEKIRSSAAPFITTNHVELTKIEKECKIDRPKMLRVLAKLTIVPEKRRRFEDNPRSVLTVKSNMVKRIKEAVKTLF